MESKIALSVKSPSGKPMYYVYQTQSDQALNMVIGNARKMGHQDCKAIDMDTSRDEDIINLVDRNPKMFLLMRAYRQGRIKAFRGLDEQLADTLLSRHEGMIDHTLPSGVRWNAGEQQDTGVMSYVSKFFSR